jgi:hypothetical protein
MRGDLFDDIGDSVWHRGSRGFDSKTLREKLTVFHVDRSAFDAGSTDVDSKKCHSDILLSLS